MGDLVNRGPDSLACLRFVKSLGERAITVLGNHDLHLACVAEGLQKRRKRDTLDEVLAAPDRDELLAWLRLRPLMHVEDGYALVHAGLLPQWSVARARALALEVEAHLAGPGYRTILEHLREQVPHAADPDLRAIVGAMGLTGDKVHQDAGTLSGGEKTKLALGILVAGRHNLLLLDEPSNNLDPGSREAIAGALGAWPGTIILVSHDTDFVRALEPDRVLLMPEGNIDHWSDDMLDLVALA